MQCLGCWSCCPAGRQNLGYVYSIRSEYDRACEQYTLAHRALSITFGPDHFTVAQVDASHGWLLLRRGLFDQALEKFREALQKRRKFFDIYLSRDQSIGEVLHPVRKHTFDFFFAVVWWYAVVLC